MNSDDWLAILGGAIFAVGLVLTTAAFAADPKTEKPSYWLCWTARAAVAAAGSEKAAEKEARAQGVSEATIAKAKRCPR